MSAKIGIFFLFISMIVLIVFCGSLQGGQPAFAYFCGGTSLLALAIILMARGYKPEPPAPRTGLLGRLRGKKKG